MNLFKLKPNLGNIPKTTYPEKMARFYLELS